MKKRSRASKKKILYWMILKLELKPLRSWSSTTRSRNCLLIFASKGIKTNLHLPPPEVQRDRERQSERRAEKEQWQRKERKAEIGTHNRLKLPGWQQEQTSEKMLTCQLGFASDAFFFLFNFSCTFVFTLLPLVVCRKITDALLLSNVVDAPG